MSWPYPTIRTKANSSGLGIPAASGALAKLAQKAERLRSAIPAIARSSQKALIERTSTETIGSSSPCLHETAKAWIWLSS